MDSQFNGQMDNHIGYWILKLIIFSFDRCIKQFLGYWEDVNHPYRVSKCSLYLYISLLYRNFIVIVLKSSILMEVHSYQE